MFISYLSYIEQYLFPSFLQYHRKKLTDLLLIHSSILNRPPVIYRGKKEESPLAYIESRNVVIDSIKESIDGKGIVVRLYEALGFRTEDTLTLSFPYEKVEECNLVEEDRRKLRSLRLELSHFEIKTLYFTR